MDILDEIRNCGGIIFGYGERGKALFEAIRQRYPEADLIFCDNDKSVQHDMNHNTTIISVDDATEKHRNKCYLLPSPAYASEMKEQLLRNGIAEEKIFTNIPRNLMEAFYEKKRKLRTRKRATLRIEIDIVKHCNLNCKGCDHFAPLAKSEFVDIDVFEKDMRRVQELFGDDVEEIFILGGEPLLHPQIEKFLQISRRLFPLSLLHIDTNGILLEKADESFWRTCSSHGVDIKVTIYPIGIDFEFLKTLAHERGVELELLQKIEPGGYHRLWKAPLDLNGTQDLWESFINCGQSNRCITLEAGRIYTCATGANMRLFNEAFPEHALQLTENDGIDIYMAKDKMEIYEYLAKPMPSCRYCDVKNRTYGIPWECSKKDIREWS